MRVGWLTLVFAVVASGELINYADYWRMPQVFEYEDFDECLFYNPDVPSVYCVVKAVIRPEQNSPEWERIANYSKDWKHHVNHAHLERGMCVRNCQSRMDVLANRTDLLVPKFPIDFPYTFIPNTFRDVESFRRNYSKMLEKCINDDLSQKHGLKAHTVIEYCDDNTTTYPIDAVDIAFMVVFLLLLATVLASSWYDHKCKSTHGLEHYKTELPSTKSMALVSFSIIRNWYRVTSRESDELNHDIRYVHTMRFLVFMGVILGHTLFYTPPKTALLIEKKYDELLTVVLVNGTQVVTTFFSISAMMLLLFFMARVQEAKRKVGILEILMTSVARYIRLTPVYAFVMLFEASWLIRFSDGPLWRKGVESGRTYCRRNWWVNLLYINNYYRVEQPCMLHTWYLAADFHLFVYGLILCTLFLRFPKLRNTIIYIALVLSYLLMVAIIYMKDYYAIPMLTPEPMRYFFWYWGTYQDTYVPTHMYLLNYTFAIGGSFYFIHLRKTRPQFHPALKIAWLICLLSIPLVFLLGFVFYRYDFETPSLWMALLFPVNRLLYTLIMVVGSIGFAFRFVKVVTRLTNLPFFTIIGRLSYSAYLCHLCCIKMGVFSTRSFTHYLFTEIGTTWAAAIFTSYLAAWLLCLMLESPFVALQKLLFTSLMRKMHPESDSSSNHSSEQATDVSSCDGKDIAPKVIFTQRL